MTSRSNGVSIGPLEGEVVSSAAAPYTPGVSSDRVAHYLDLSRRLAEVRAQISGLEARQAAADILTAEDLGRLSSLRAGVTALAAATLAARPSDYAEFSRPIVDTRVFAHGAMPPVETTGGEPVSAPDVFQVLPERVSDFVRVDDDKGIVAVSFPTLVDFKRMLDVEAGVTSDEPAYVGDLFDSQTLVWKWVAFLRQVEASASIYVDAGGRKTYEGSAPEVLAVAEAAAAEVSRDYTSFSAGLGHGDGEDSRPGGASDGGLSPSPSVKNLGRVDTLSPGESALMSMLLEAKNFGTRKPYIDRNYGSLAINCDNASDLVQIYSVAPISVDLPGNKLLDPSYYNSRIVPVGADFLERLFAEFPGLAACNIPLRRATKSQLQVVFDYGVLKLKPVLEQI